MIKNQNIELLRIVSAFGIVWYHSGTMGREFAYSGLVIFLIMSMYLAGKSNGIQSLPNRTQRLLLPWAVWFSIYGMINLFMHKPVILMAQGMVAGILLGSSSHLWYMPFIFLCLLLFDVIRRYASAETIAWGSAILAILILGATPLWRPYSLAFGGPWPQYAHALAAVFIGVFLAYYERLHQFALPLLLAITASVIVAIPYPDVGIPYLLGLAGSFCLLFLASARFPFNVSTVSRCTPGIYFMHVLLLMIVGKLYPLSGPILPMTVFVCAFFIVLSLRTVFPRQAHYWS